MNILTVTQINRIIKQDIENHPLLRSIQVTGEVSNFKHHSSGHFYFDLKDNESRISCVMWATYANNVHFKIENGMKVTVTCSCTTYVVTGTYQLSCFSIDPVGVGDLFLQFEELKKKLYTEGLFNEEHKQKLPKFPMNIGVVSAKEGAAIQDVITTVKRRWPLAQITLVPSLVQGKFATDSLVRSLKFADKQGFDEIIVTRGGGSLEDMWCFNEEAVARTVYDMKTPVISAVGHEVDTTIIDFVSDVRAPTPTGAGEIGTPNLSDVKEYIKSLSDNITIIFKNLLKEKKTLIQNYKENPYLANIEHLFADRYAKLQLLESRLISSKKDLLGDINNKLLNYKNQLMNLYKMKLNNCQNLLINLSSQLDTLSPLKTMSRGYGIISKDKEIITEVSKVNENDQLNIKMRDGNVDVKVLKVNKGE